MTGMTSVGTEQADVTLRPLRMTDKFAIRRWMADRNVIDFTVVVPSPAYGPVVPYSADDADRYLELLVRDPERRSCAILLNGDHVGNVGLKAINQRRGTAECFIEVGELAARRRGVGARAMTAMLDIAFDELRVQSVRLGVFEFNDAAIALYRKIGFVDDGRLGDHWVRGRVYAVNAMRVDQHSWLRGRLRPRP
jgi:RimJ/RimL family protein N-acetyltransferase